MLNFPCQMTSFRKLVKCRYEQLRESSTFCSLKVVKCPISNLLTLLLLSDFKLCLNDSISEKTFDFEFSNQT